VVSLRKKAGERKTLCLPVLSEFILKQKFFYSRGDADESGGAKRRHDPGGPHGPAYCCPERAHSGLLGNKGGKGKRGKETG
jgi:hypothetical protein